MIYVTAHDLDEEQAAAFSDGADDYIVKPFSLPVLLGRVQAVLRRMEGQTGSGGKGAEKTFRCGRLLVDFSAARVTLDDKALSLTPTEYKLLCALTSHPGQLLTRGQLLEQLWDKDADFVDEHTLTLNISRLRAKLGEGYIETVRGMGYRWRDRREERDG